MVPNWDHGQQGKTMQKANNNLYDNINKLSFWILTRNIIHQMQNVGTEEIPDVKSLLQAFFFFIVLQGRF